MTQLLPQGWAWATLAEVAQWGSGGTPRKSEPQYYGGEIPWAVIGDLNDGIVETCKERITSQGLSESNCKLVKPGTVLLAIYGASIGRLGIAGTTMATNQAIAFAVPRINRWYLFYYLLSQRLLLLAAGQGGAQKNISQTIVKAWSIPVPPTAEQKRIVKSIEETLSSVDGIADTLGLLLDKLELLRSAILADAFYANRPLPSNWEYKRLGELGVEVKGQTRPTPGRTYDLYSVPAFFCSQPERLNGSEIQSGKRTVMPGDVLLCKINPRINRVRWVGPADGYPLLASTEYLVLRLYDSTLIQYLQQYLSSAEFRRWIELSVEGATGSHTRAKSGPILQQCVPVAPAAERKQIVERNKEGLIRLDALKLLLVSSLQEITLVRQAVLDEAFAGRLVPQDPDDEPAFALLERIAKSPLAKAAQPKVKA